MVNQQQITGWKWLKEQLTKVRDNTLRFAMIAEFRKKAYKDWGFNPDNGKINISQKIELDDWEKEFVEDINKTQMYELDIRAEKRKKTEREAITRMKQFIDSGGHYVDLPEELQNKHTFVLYKKAWDELLKDIEENLKIVKKRFTNDKKDSIIQ